MFRTTFELDTNANSDNDELSFDHGSIIFAEDGKTANIIFFDQIRSWKATLKIYDLAHLKKIPLFRQADKIEGNEILVNTWFTKRCGNTIIKFSDNTQLGFIFSSEGNLIDDLKKITILHFEHISYFKERQFGDFVFQYLKLTSHDLRIMGVEEKRIQLFSNYLSGLLNLINHGASTEKLMLADINNLETYLNLSEKEMDNLLIYFSIADMFKIDANCVLPILNNLDNLKLLLQHGLTVDHLKEKYLPILQKCLKAGRLPEVLQFVTIGQIFKLDPTPLPLKKLLKNQSMPTPTYITHFGSGTDNGFHFDYNESGILVTYAHFDEVECFNLILLKANEEVLSSLSEQVTSNGSQLFSLVHDWYLIKDKNADNNNVLNNIIYSPELNYIMRETYSINFPIDRLKNDTFILMLCPYYEEKTLANSLQKNGYAIDTIRLLPGMTTQKLEWFCQYQDVLLDLLAHQVTFEDLAKVNEERLHHIMAHYDKAKYALAFVPAIECLGLVNPSPSLTTINLFSSHQHEVKNETDTNEYSSFCMIS